MKGDILRIYYDHDKGAGSYVRGLALNGELLHYKTSSQFSLEKRYNVMQLELTQREDASKRRQEVLARVNNLPEAMRIRVKQFEVNNKDFWWRYEEYELFCLEEAHTLYASLTPRELRHFHKLGWEEQCAKVPGMSQDHSGRTLAAAIYLARLYLAGPNYLLVAHGALCGPIPCKDYGCKAS